MDDRQGRYTRQITLPEIGETGQEKISAASVLCIGAGGLGCPALLYLAAAGVGHIGIVDFDNVDESNLQRQVLFTTAQINQNKAAAAKNRLDALNPGIKITAHEEELTDKNAEELFNFYDIIIDGTDNFDAKFLINDAGVKFSKPVIYGSISGFDGQASVFEATRGPCYRCLYPAPPKTKIMNCAEAGVIGAVAGIVGTVQAMEAIKLIVGGDKFTPLIGQLWTIDTHNMASQTLVLSKNPACPVCATNKKEITLEYSSPVCGIIPEVTAAQAKENTEALLIDVREQNEWDSGHIEGARHFALSEISEGNFPDLPKDKNVILYCQGGVRSIKAAQILKGEGYLNLVSMAGGYMAWLKAA